MVKNLRFILGGLAFATTVALGKIDASVVTGTNNAPPVAETKVPEIASFNTIYTNNILHVEIRGKSNNANFKKYFLQSTTNLASNSWQDISTLDDCADLTKEEFVFYEPLDSERKFYRINYSK